MSLAKTVLTNHRAEIVKYASLQKEAFVGQAWKMGGNTLGKGMESMGGAATRTMGQRAKDMLTGLWGKTRGAASKAGDKTVGAISSAGDKMSSAAGAVKNKAMDAANVAGPALKDAGSAIASKARGAASTANEALGGLGRDLAYAGKHHVPAGIKNLPSSVGKGIGATATYGAGAVAAPFVGAWKGGKSFLKGLKSGASGATTKMKNAAGIGESTAKKTTNKLIAHPEYGAVTESQLAELTQKAAKEKAAKEAAEAAAKAGQNAGQEGAQQIAGQGGGGFWGSLGAAASRNPGIAGAAIGAGTLGTLYAGGRLRRRPKLLL